MNRMRNREEERMEGVIVAANADGAKSARRGCPSARNLTPVPSPIALPPTGRGGLGWSGGVSSRRHRSDPTDPSDRTDFKPAAAIVFSPSAPGRGKGGGRRGPG